MKKVIIMNPVKGEATHTSQIRAEQLLKNKRAVLVRRCRASSLILCIKLIATSARTVATKSLVVNPVPLSDEELSSNNTSEMVERTYDLAISTGILFQSQAHSLFAGQIERLGLPA